MAADLSYQPGFQLRQGGNAAVPTGKALDIESGGALKLNGVDVTAGLVAAASASTGTANGTVAAAGSVQGDAAAIASDICVVTGADGTKGAILPPGVAGMQILVKNNTAAVLKIYPGTSAAVNALSANAAISMASLTCAIFAATSATQWYTCPLLPS